MFSASFWRRGTYVLAVLLVVACVCLYLKIGYPQAWDKVQIGMPASQVRAICGGPTHSSGMGPDIWEKPFLYGKWVMEIASGDYAEDPRDVVYGLSVHYEHPLAWKDIVLRSDYPPIQDYAAFMRAFGLIPDPHKQYRVVSPPKAWR